MFKSLICFCVLFSIFLFPIFLQDAIAHTAFCSTAIEQATDNDILISFQLSNYITSKQLIDGQEYTQFSITGEGETYNTGRPQLPLVTRYIAIPAGAKPRVTVEVVDTLHLAHTVPYPRQAEDARPQNRVFGLDAEFYASGSNYPSATCTVGTAAVFRDFSLTPITIAPFQYDPLTHTVTVTNQASIRISWQEVPASRTNHTISRAFESTYQNLIMNYDDVSRDATYQTPCYLFIMPDSPDVLQTLSSLLEWKRQLGYEVHMATTAETGTTTTSIKDYIQSAYSSWENPPEYVCLVGDANGTFEVPCYIVSGGSGDHGYTLLEGDDLLSDIHIGRLSFNSIFELQTIVNKIMKYEKEPFVTSPEWFERAVLVGDPSTSGQSCVDTNLYIKSLIEDANSHFSFTELYTGNYTNGTVDAIDNGVSYYNYRGYIGMSGFSTAHIDALSNGYMMPFAVTLTCGTGNLMSFSDCISERFVKAGTPSVPKGAIAAVATATVNTHTTFNNCISSGIYTGLFAENCQSVGAAFTRGKTNLSICFPQNPASHINSFSYWNNLIGDPGLRLWTHPPHAINCTIPTQVPLGQTNLSLQVFNSQGDPLQDAWVTIYKSDEEFSCSDLTDQQGWVTLPSSPSTIGEAMITISAQNQIPLQQSVSYYQESRYLHCQSVQVDDDTSGTSNGNNDAMINPGETIELGILLHNSGTVPVEGVTATISTTSPWVTIIDATETYPDIPPESTAICLDDFDLTVDQATPYGTLIPLTLEISDALSNSWTDELQIPVITPIIAISGLEVYDTGNNQLDPGETTQIGLTLSNSGLMNQGPISAILRIPHDEIAVLDSLGSYPTIAANSSGTNQQDTFTVSVGLSVYSGMQVPAQLQIETPWGYNQILDCIIDIGETTPGSPLVSTHYLCFDDDDVAFSQAPQYNWIEINPDNGGSGTHLSLYDCGNMGDAVLVDMPFPLVMYGAVYDQIMVCTNGWIAGGYTNARDYMNWPLPGSMGPNPMIAPFWDDLTTNNGSGHVTTWYDETDHRFIIEWSRMINEYDFSTEETFEVILYDVTHYPTTTGDCEILFQYKDINNIDSGNYSGGSINHGQYATIGLEGPSPNQGIQYSYNNTYPTAAKPLEDEMAILFTPMAGPMLAPPVITLSTDSLYFAVDQTGMYQQNFSISNNGIAPLDYSLDIGYQDDASRNQGGPDNYDHFWIDSREPNGPEYSWRPLSGTETPVNFSDNNTATALLPLDFTFHYYGQEYEQFRISPNGWIGFGDDTPEWNNLSLPNPSSPKPAIIPFWDDLSPLTGGDVYYLSTPDSLIVWFIDIPHTPGNYTGTYTFQTVLHPDGTILIQYQTMIGSTDSATIGMQNHDNSDALQISYNTPFVEDNLAVIIQRDVAWMHATPDVGQIIGNQHQDITVTIEPQELLMGTYSGTIVITSNDPSQTLSVIPVTMDVVGSVPAIHIATDCIDFGDVPISTSRIDTLQIHNLGNQTLQITSIQSTNATISPQQTTYTIEPFTSSPLLITFSPLELGVQQAVITLYSNDPNTPEFTIEAMGNGVENSVAGTPVLPVTALFANHPNPFNPTTAIRFSLAPQDAEDAVIEIFNIRGQSVSRLPLSTADTQQGYVIWDGRDSSHHLVASGLYLYQLSSSSGVRIQRKMMLLK